MSTHWLCLRCLLAEKKVPAVTMYDGTVLCQTCAQEAIVAVVATEIAHVVHAPVPATWPRLFSRATVREGDEEGE